MSKGDIVRLAGDPPLHAIVVATSSDGITRGHLIVQPLCGGSKQTRDVRTRDVVVSWRRRARERVADE